MPDRFDSVENALRGKWTMSCERGKVAAALTLAPTMPPTSAPAATLTAIASGESFTVRW